MRTAQVLALLLSACAEQPVTAPPDGPTVSEPPACVASVGAPAAVGEGSPYCEMVLTVYVTCPAGGSGHLFAVYGEVGGPTPYAASTDAAYICGQVVHLTRDGISCTAKTAADVTWWTPDGAGPNACQQQ